MRIGQAIRINHPNGSWGTIIDHRHYDDGFYVKYNYGKDVKGEYITSTASVDRNDIVAVDENVYAQYINCRAL